MGEGTGARARVVFRGSVQGVGFRYTTIEVASSFEVTGFVRNEADGSVELVAEGERAEVEAFLDAVSRRMARHARSRDVAWAPATGEFQGFGIRFWGD